MRLDNFDLNLLVAFDILLEERNVTTAAARANLTQSAMSAALKRLREAFQDEILAQQGKKMVPTPYALAMHPEIALRIADLRALISRKGTFEPALSERKFKIVASDYITSVLLVPLLNSFSEIAPSITFDIALPNTETSHRLGNGDIDLALTPEEFVHPDHPCELVFEERHVLVGWSENPALGQAMTKQDLTRLGHVAVSITGKNTFVERWMSDAGIERRVEVYVPSFQQAPYFLPGTNRVCVMHERLAKMMAEQMPLAIAELPFDVPPMREMLQYHATREKDPGLEWLRTQINLLCEKMP